MEEKWIIFHKTEYYSYIMIKNCQKTAKYKLSKKIKKFNIYHIKKYHKYYSIE